MSMQCSTNSNTKYPKSMEEVSQAEQMDNEDSWETVGFVRGGGGRWSKVRRERKLTAHNELRGG